MVNINRTTLQLVMVFALVVSLLSLAKKSEAQDINFARLEPGTNRVHMSFGLDPALVTTVGYSRGIALGDRAALVDLDIGMAAAEADFQDLRARIGFQTTFLQLGDWRVAVRGRLIARTTSNSIYDGTGFSADLTSYVGFYRRGWFAAALIGYDRQCVMHIKHTDWYREYFYENAVDGWYRGKAGILHVGLVTGIAAGPVEIALRLETRRVGGGERLDPPFVGSLNLSYPF
jgi:hypothetical protein